MGNQGTSQTAAVGSTLLPNRRRPVSPVEQARREAWGKDAGAKVAAAYKQLQEETPQ